MNKSIRALITAAAAITLFCGAATAQTVKVGAEVQLNKDQRNAVRMEVTKPVGPVNLSLELKSTLAKDGFSGKSELVGGVKYNSPIVFWGVTPFVKGELGLTTSAKNRSFVGLEVGGAGDLEGPYSWEAAYRVRDPVGGKNESRYRATVFYDVDDSTKVGGSLLVWDAKNVTTTGVGVDLIKKF